MTPTPLTVSLSGADKIGKTTTLSLFPRNWPLTITHGLDTYSPAVAEILRNNTWFGSSTVSPSSDDEFVVAIATACIARLGVTTKDSGKTLIVNGERVIIPGLALDRSAQMYKAVCIARTMVLRCLPLSQAEARVDAIISQAGVAFPAETVAILLTLDDKAEKRVAHTLQACTPGSDVYPAYQAALQEVLDYQAAQGVYTVLTKPSHEPAIETLYRVTALIQAQTEGYVWRPLLANIKACLAFGGLSECGKSSMCTATVRHNGDQAFRVKISYLCDLASGRLGQSIYALSTNTRALELVHELDQFVRWHRWLRYVTLDSLHNYDVTERLTELIGNRVPGQTSGGQVPYSQNAKLLVVYIDTPLELRISRTEAGGDKFDPEKDVVKRSRGAHQVEAIADLVVRNDGTFQTMFDTVWAVAKTYGDSQ